MANEKNLKSNSERTPRERKELAQKAGIKSGEARREKKLLKQVAEDKLLELMGNGKSFQENAIEQLQDAVLNGRIKPTDLVKILEFLRDTSGQKPTDKQEITNNNTSRPRVYFTEAEFNNLSTEEIIKKLRAAANCDIHFMTKEEEAEYDAHIDAIINGTGEYSL